MAETMLALGLMSGTSLDGIDAALIETDGDEIAQPVAFVSEAYTDEDRAVLRSAAARALTLDRPAPDPEIDAAAGRLTDLHIAAVRRLLEQADLPCSGVGVIGFHGQTVAHRPDRGWTWQIGDGARMAAALGITVVDDFRSADVGAGGQGAPLLPVYHRAMTAELPRPLAVLNLGGVGNLTWIGEGEDIVAFDTGPANAPIDDWVLAHTGERFDKGGRIAGAGQPDEVLLTQMLSHPFFDIAPPKSLDRADFTSDRVQGLSVENGAATLTAFAARSVARGLAHVPTLPKQMLVAGGGRHNPVLMSMLADACGLPVDPIDLLGRNGDATEAEGFAYMAARTLRGLPISFPGTTGAPHPLEGGRINRP
ncbi:anhydro-N-acetylmuramic acid kinase [Sphingomonas sp. ID0503]|uniref:anhydro-N-acetylmuramic acid kinase n=1 Tax=Sphingomonas sp. ID0503 TaxID=3399691 RepID=UPI003AFA89C0